MSLLDTSVLVELLRRKKYEFASISVITLIEILRGVKAEKRERVKDLIERSFDVIGLDNRVVETYCDLYDRLRERGEMISDADLLIAATAISRGLTLRTSDKKHFERLKKYGLKLDLT
jgi:hypothetical protein